MYSERERERGKIDTCTCNVCMGYTRNLVGIENQMFYILKIIYMLCILYLEKDSVLAPGDGE